MLFKENTSFIWTQAVDATSAEVGRSIANLGILEVYRPVWDAIESTYTATTEVLTEVLLEIPMSHHIVSSEVSFPQKGGDRNGNDTEADSE